MSILSYINRITAKAELMQAMLRRVGVDDWFGKDPRRAATLRRATMNCMSCGHQVQCQTWLEGHLQADRAPDFCSNQNLIDRILTNRPAA